MKRKLHLDEVAHPPGEDEPDDHDHGGLESFSLGLDGVTIPLSLRFIWTMTTMTMNDDDDHDDDHDHEGEEEHGDALPFGLEGLKAGKTEIKLQLLHGDHPDFTAALPIPVTVQ